MDESRRRLLALLGTASVSTLAGCGSSDGTDETPTATETAPPREAILAPSNGDDLFGYSVGVSGDGTTAVIGAFNDEDQNGDDAGSAYVFQRENGGWSEETILAVSDSDAAIEESGLLHERDVSVTVSGDGTTVIIGAIDEDPGGGHVGSAYVFQRNGGQWGEETQLTATDGDEDDGFGGAVTVSSDGTTAVIGAIGHGLSGSAYVFQREEGRWREEAKLDAAAGDGNSIGVSGDGTTAVIGAIDENPNGPRVGSAYVFQWDGGQWSEETQLTVPDSDENNGFGRSVGVSSDGTTAVIGAPTDRDPNEDGAGSVYVFQRDGGQWNEETKLTAPEGDSEKVFGGSIGVSGDGTTAVIGAIGMVNGSAYVFHQKEGEWDEETKITDPDAEPSDDFGNLVGVSGDGTTAVIGTDPVVNADTRQSGWASVYRLGGER
jgi:hypothetical protein